MRPRLLLPALLFALCGGFGCGEFLTVDPEDEISRAEVFSTLRGAEAAVIGLYNLLSDGDYYQIRMPIYGDLAPNFVPPRDPGSATNAQRQQYLVHYALDPGASYPTSTMDAVYVHAYRLLYQANDVLANLEALAEGTEEQRASLRGEALAVRAVVHFDLLRLFAQAPGFSADASHPGIALVTGVPDVFDAPGRATVAEGYAAVKADLEAAEMLLDPALSRRSGDPFWLTPTVVRGLRARVAAYERDWAACLEWADRCLNGTTRELTPTDRYVDSWKNGRLSETLWALDLQRYPEQDGSEPRLSSPALVVGAGNEDPFLQVDPALLDLLPAGDLRRELLTTSPEGNLLSEKWPYALNEISNPVMLRLSEVHLLRAEAAAELGREDVANAAYRRVRQRANPEEIIPALAGDGLRAAIRAERRLELLAEGHHFFDLGRRGADLLRAPCAGEVAVCDLAYPSPRYVLPIPLSALLRNPNLTQNPGY